MLVWKKLEVKRVYLKDYLKNKKIKKNRIGNGVVLYILMSIYNRILF